MNAAIDCKPPRKVLRASPRYASTGNGPGLTHYDVYVEGIEMPLFYPAHFTVEDIAKELERFGYDVTLIRTLV